MASARILELLIDENNQLRTNQNILLMKISTLEAMIDWYSKMMVWFQLLIKIFYFNTYYDAFNEALSAVTLLTENLMTIPVEMFLSFESIVNGHNITAVHSTFTNDLNVNMYRIMSAIQGGMEFIKKTGATELVTDFFIIAHRTDDIDDVKMLKIVDRNLFERECVTFLKKPNILNIPAGYEISQPSFLNLVSRLQIVNTFATQLFNKIPYTFQTFDESQDEWSFEIATTFLLNYWNKTVNCVIKKTGYFLDIQNILPVGCQPIEVITQPAVGSCPLDLDDFLQFSASVKRQPLKNIYDSKIETYWDTIYMDILNGSTSPPVRMASNSFTPNDWLSTCNFVHNNKTKLLNNNLKTIFDIIFDMHASVNDYDSCLYKLRCTLIDQNIILRTIIKHLIIRYQIFINAHNLNQNLCHDNFIVDPLKLLIAKLK